MYNVKNILNIDASSAHKELITVIQELKVQKMMEDIPKPLANVVERRRQRQ